MSTGRWVPCLVVGILGMSLIANIILIRSAAADPNFVSEPDYYRDAVAWDAHMARERASTVLGWHTTARLTPGADGHARLTLHIVDANDAAITDARLHVTTSPNLCMRQRTGVDAQTGVAADVGPACPGLWRLDIEASRGEQHFSERLVVELGGTQ